MLKHASLHGLTVTIATAIGLTCSISASRAAGLPEMLKNSQGSTAPAARQMLGALSNPRAARQAALVTCNSKTSFGADTCVIVLDTVPTGHVLQIDKVQCLGGSSNGTMVIFNTKLVIDSAHLVGFTLAPYDTAGGSETQGPIYFKAGERPKFAASASDPTTQAFCSTFGTLWQAN